MRSGSELAQYAGSMWVHYFIATFIASLGLVIAIAICQVLGKSSLLPGLWALLGAGPILFREAIRRFSFANLQVRSAIALDVFVAILQLGGLVLLSYWGRLSLYSTYAVMSGSCLIAGLCWLGLEQPKIRLVPQRILPDWQLNWGFGKWTLRSYLIGDTTFYIALWMLSATSESPQQASSVPRYDRRCDERHPDWRWQRPDAAGDKCVGRRRKKSCSELFLTPRFSWASRSGFSA